MATWMATSTKICPTSLRSAMPTTRRTAREPLRHSSPSQPARRSWEFFSLAHRCDDGSAIRRVLSIEVGCAEEVDNHLGRVSWNDMSAPVNDSFHGRVAIVIEFADFFDHRSLVFDFDEGVGLASDNECWFCDFHAHSGKRQAGDGGDGGHDLWARGPKHIREDGAIRETGGVDVSRLDGVFFVHGGEKRLEEFQVAVALFAQGKLPAQAF